MAISTYAELRTAIANWLDRSDLTDRIPEFITLAEARFNRVIRAPDMLTRDDAFVVDGQYEALPAGFVGPRRLVLQTSPVTPLTFLTPEEMADRRAERTAAGKPRFYSVVGGNFEFLPTPDSAYTASALYYARITAVSSSFNWLATNHPDIYMWGALVVAEPFIQNDPRLPVWGTQLNNALAELGVLNDRMSVPSGAAPRPRSFG